MKKYEAIIVVDSGVGEDKVAESVSKFEADIAASGGSVVSKDAWGRRKLAYQINKKEFGHYYYFVLELPADATSKLERELKISESVLRFLIVLKDKFAPDLSDVARRGLEETVNGLEGEQDAPASGGRSFHRPAQR